MLFEFTFANFNDENVCNHATKKCDKNIIKHSNVCAFEGDFQQKNVHTCSQKFQCLKFVQ